MENVLFALRMCLAGIFLLAAIAKLADHAVFRETVAAFGVPSKWVSAVSVAVVQIELVVAMLLLWADTAWWGGVSALVLLALLNIAIGVNLARGNKPSCQCFGQLHSAPISKATLLRNVALACGAILIVWQGQDHTYTGLGHWVNGIHGVMPIVVAVLTVALSIQGWLVFHLLRQHGRLLLSIDNLDLRLDAEGIQRIADSTQWLNGLPVGTPAPAFDLPLLSGGRATLDDLLQPRHPLLLVFSDPQCSPCTALLPDIAMWARAHAHELSIALVSRGTIEENSAKIADFEITRVLLQQERELAEQYSVQATPSAVLVSAAGLIDAPLAVGATAIAQLVTHVATSRVAAVEPAATRRKNHNNMGAAATGGDDSAVDIGNPVTVTRAT